MAPSDKRSNANPALARNDFALMETQTETEVAQTLRDRFVRDVVYTRIGARVMVSINPGKPLASSNEATCAEYVEEYKNPTREPLNPHIFQVASGAYLHLRRTGLDQAIVLQGETGSGKTENLKLILKYYDSLRSQSKKESKIFQQLLDAHSVLESFGSARTFRNPMASRFGLYTEIQFSSRGRIIGAKLMDYHLEKSRLTLDHNNGSSERNFSILYQLMAGCTVEERQRWRLKEASNYYYLGGSHRKALEVSSDEPKMEELRNSLKSIGIGKKQQSQIFRALAAIIHLGNIEFVDPEHVTTQESAYIKNDEQLVDAADMLGVHARALEGVLTYRQQLVNRDIVTIFLSAAQAAKQRDLLSRSLYGLLWSWLLEQMNDRLCSDNDQASFIGILDIVGFQADAIRAGFRAANFDQFIFNSIAERINHFGLHQLFSVGNDELVADGLSVANIEHIDNASSLDLLLKPRTGLLAVMDRCSAEEDDEYLLSNMQKQHSENPLYLTPPARLRSFAIQHFAGQCIYDVQGFTTATNDSLSADFVTLFRGNGADLPGSVNAFITGLFESKSVVLESHARNAGVVVAAQQKNGPTRAPSMKKPKQAASETAIAEGEKKKRLRGVGNQVHTAIGELVDSLNETKSWFVFCLRPHETAGAGIDLKYVKAQVRYFQLSAITTKKINCRYTMSYTHQEFLDRFTVVIPFTSSGGVRDTQSKCHAAATVLNFTSDMCVVGRERVWLSEDAWRQLEQSLRSAENEARARRHGGEGGGDMSMVKSPFMLASVAGSVYGDEGQSYISDDEFNNNYQRMESLYESESVRPTEDEDTDLQRGEAGAEEENAAPAEEQLSLQRRQWVGCTWCLTWWVPTKAIAACGIKRPDVQMAWREKLALFIIILFMCLFMMFFIVAFGPIVCPKQNVYTAYELQGHSQNSDAYTSIRGEVFDITNYTVHHGVTFKEIMQSNQFAGKDSSLQFPVQVSQLCDGADGRGIDFSVSLQNYTKENAEPAFNHDYRWYRFPDRVNEYPDRYSTLMNQLRATIKKGYVGWDPSLIQQQGRDNGRNIAVINDQVFDLTDYNNGNIYSLFPGGSTGNRVNTKFMDPDLASLFSQLKGTDITPQFEAIFKKKSKALKRRMQVCLRNLFFVGLLDYRNSFRCRFSEFLLLFISALMVAVIFFKFLASLQLAGRRTPQEYDKFVICNVPCYTEDEESLKRTIDSLTVLKYDDKRKLLFIVADGMIVGSGNDRPTPRIVLDILGVDPSVDPEPLAFQSLGDGMKQLNYAKVYTGLYECRGHVVPYLVVIKVGKPTERQRPGNRGKRDSQMLLMRFFNAVHYGKEMTPLELEIYHQMKNVIGVDPSFYEYVLMVDADTLVYPDSLNRMVSCLVHDAKIMGICGETTLMNAKATWITMMQVYEYYISHHMSKAFESLFGSVTCLPGCFSMYRLRTPDKGNPLLIHNHIIEDYSENKVDTLHKKNLLHLGEDRYLTTLMLKHFPNRKMTFTPDATCETNAPDSFKVLLSQRRRWINSTVHNLVELLLLDRLCGFCCFSMRFVVFLDLFGTIVMPATVCYLVYLLYKGFTTNSQLIMVSLIMFAVVYGLQAIVFLVRRKWEHIGWMIVYILAIPYSGLFIPLYSFWHFDDFSWGNTRMVVGEKGDKKYTPADEEKFDPKCIPRKRWQDYEQEVMWEATSDSSKAARQKMGSVAGSVYGGIGPEYGGGGGGGGIPLSRPASNYTSISLNMPPPISMEMTQIPRSQTPVISGGFPSDEQILMEIRRLLENADLMVVTKKQIREDLSRSFNMDMSSKKEYISQCIDMILHGGAS